MEQHYVDNQAVLIDIGALHVLVAASVGFLGNAQSFRDAGQDVSQDLLDTLTEAIRIGREALGKEEQ